MRLFATRRTLAMLVAALMLVTGLAMLVAHYAPPVVAGPPLSAHSTQPQGALALSLWLDSLGYKTGSLEYQPFAIDPKARALLILAPTQPVTDAQASEIFGWVERGGTLILVTDHGGPLLDRLGVKVSALHQATAISVPLEPVFQRPALRQVDTKAASALSFSRSEWVPLLGLAGSERDVVAGTAQLGSGRAFVLTAAYPLSNEGLGKSDDWALASYFLKGIPMGGLVLFDEYHHGFTEYGTLDRMLFTQPWGWAILYVVALLFAFVALSGRRLGPALAAVVAGPRRSRSEYVATLAALLRQGKHTEWLRQQFVGQVKRSLGSRYRVRADLPAAEFVAALTRVRPEAEEMARPLQQLEQGADSDERAVVDLIRDVEKVRARLLGLSV